MIEKTLRDYLNERMDVPVHMERPKHPPESFIVLERTGGTIVEHLKRSTFAMQCYASTMYGAAQLCDALTEAVMESVVLADVSSVSLNTSYNYTKTDSKEYRYQAVFEIWHY